MSIVGRSTALITLAAAALLIAPAVAAAGVADISVEVDRPQISTKLGDDLRFRSTIANDGTETATGLIAHLNVLSLQPGTYVDPEDWSSDRTRYLDPIPPGGSVTLDWPMQAVNDGHFAVYVAVLPESGVASPPLAGPTVRLDVASRRKLNAGGLLPIALGVPAVIGALGAGVRLVRRRR